MTTITQTGDSEDLVTTDISGLSTVTSNVITAFIDDFDNIDLTQVGSSFQFTTHTATAISGYDPGTDPSIGGELTLAGTNLLLLPPANDTVNGSGTFTTASFTTGTVVAGDFISDGDSSFHAVGKINWSVVDGVGDVTSASLTSLSMTDGTDSIALTGSGIGFTPGTDALTGHATHETLTHDGLTVAITSSAGIDLSDGAGTASSIVFSDSDGAVTVAGALSVDLLFSGSDPTIQDYLTDPSLLSGADKVTGSAGDDVLLGFAGADALTGGAGNDTLDGGTGNDVMTGGTGNDIYFVDSIADKVVEAAGGGTDTVYASVSYTLAANVEDLVLTGPSNINGTGNTLSNTLLGNAGDNTLDGMGGGDTMVGGDGNDTYILHTAGDVVTEDPGSGNDTVVIDYNGSTTVAQTLNLSDYANVENMTIKGTGLYNITGTTGDNHLVGNASVNVLTGGGGNDTLDGGAGADTMIGGAGNDTYVVDNAGDVIQDTGGSNTVDLNMASGTFTMATGVDTLVMGGTGALHVVGNSSGDNITGNAGANVIDGSAGGDSLYTMAGGAGNDTYIIDNTSDVIVENVGAGTDLVESPFSYSLGANVENLTLTGTLDVDGTGNSGNNTITGNGGNNTLDGGDGGTDRLVGGMGNDTYIIQVSAVHGALFSSVAVTDTGGVDTIELRSDGTLDLTKANTLNLGTTFENFDISQTGSTLLNINGNAADNILTGNDANNTLNGGTGTDHLIGGLGDDTYILGSASDVVTENSGEGNDTVVIAYANAGHTAVELHLSDYANVENLSVTGTGLYNLTGDANDNVLTGNASVNVLTGGGGNDTLNGGVGADTMIGGPGNDTFMVDNAHDVIQGGGGSDIILSSISYTLPAVSGAATVELTGKSLAAIGNDFGDHLIGNVEQNTLIGGAGADTLDGGAGIDRLTGGDGADVFVFHAVDAVSTANADIITDFHAGVGGDALDISDVLAGHYTGGSLDEYVRLVGSGVNTVVSVDITGTGTHFIQLATLYSITPTALGGDADHMLANGNLIIPS